jgi:hypothetical protein
VRDYSKVSPSFWTGETGKELRRRGFEALLVGTYLMTSPTSNMLGLYYQPVLYMAHETGLGVEGATKGLQHCIDCGFCKYDEGSDMVWVIEMALYQIAEALKVTDLRCKGIQKDYDALPNNRFLGEFFDRYEAAFHMRHRRDSTSHSTDIPKDPSQAPSKPGAGSGGEPPDPPLFAEGAGAPPVAPAPKARTAAKPRAEPAPTAPIWDAYSGAYENRYSAPPVRNAKVNGQLAQLLQRLGADEAPGVAKFYVGYQRQDYIRAMHPVDLLLRDAEALRTAWATKRQVTNSQAQQADRTQTNANAFAPLLAAARAAKETEHG